LFARDISKERLPLGVRIDARPRIGCQAGAASATLIGKHFLAAAATQAGFLVFGLAGIVFE
jgi:hypothetical protein